MPRQQRPARSRRQGNANLPPGFGLVSFGAPVIQSANVIRLFPEMQSFPPVADPEFINLLIVGIPQILRTIPETFPTAVEVNAPNSFDLTYAGAAITPGERFQIGPWDPSMRTREGSWASSCFLFAASGG